MMTRRSDWLFIGRRAASVTPGTFRRHLRFLAIGLKNQPTNRYNGESSGLKIRIHALQSPSTLRIYGHTESENEGDSDSEG